jgi:hypothetical protein
VPIDELMIVHVHLDRDLVDDLERIGQRLLESLDDDNGVNVAFELRQSLRKHLAR